jgi:hypothetical protein
VQLAHEWFRKSYLHVLVVTIAELHVSRESPGWSRVRTFVDACRERHLEYLVICVADDNAVRVHKKVLEKLRAEVNLTTRGRERVVTVPTASANEELKPISHLHHSPAHQDLLVRLRECARDGVEARVQAYEGEAARSYAGRHSAAWSATAFFSLKEGMSFVFVQIGRRDLALKCYDELAAAMSERDEFGTRGFSAADDDADAAVGVVDPYAKDFRRMIIDGDVTELDIRTYLFARQVSLLLVDRKYSEVAERGLKFITAVARRAAEEAGREPPTLSPVFRDAWVFRAARALAAVLAPAIPSSAAAANALSKQLSTARERHTARLIAGFHVHALKAFSGLAQLALPGALASSVDANHDEVREVSAPLREALANMSDDMLRSALSEPARAVELYSEMANAAASLYEMGGRARGAAALDGDAGVVRLRNKSPVEAEELLSAQCSRFTEDHGWDQLHRRRRVELANAEKGLNRVQEYLVSCLTMLFMTRARRRLGLTCDTQDGDLQFYREEAARWVSEAQSAAGQLPRVMKYKAEKLLLVSLRPNDEPWNEGDAACAVVIIESDLPTDVKIDSVYAELRWVPPAGGPGDQAPGRPPAASALHRPDLDDGGGSVDDASLAASAASPGELPETLTLTGKGAVTVGLGVTLVHVSAQEVPRPGRYVVTQVSLVVGRLKLVQAAAKAPTIPTVTTKGSTSVKVPSAALAASAAQADLPGSTLRFPCYFASPRPPSASLRVEVSDRLYLMPSVDQYVSVTVTAGPSGVAAGALLQFAVTPPNDTAPSPSAARCVELVDRPAASGSGAGSTVLAVKVSGPTRTAGELELARPILPNKSHRAVVALRVVDNLAAALGQGDAAEGHLVGRVAVLRTSIVCAELESSRKLAFSCKLERRLPFYAPLQVAARIELSSSGDELPVAQSTAPGGDFGAPHSAAGGLLLCSLRSCAGVGKSVTLKSASLVLPPWLELLNESSPPHSSLMPQRIRNNGVFSLAFDTGVCNHATSERSGEAVAAATSPPGSSALAPRKSERTLSRLADQLHDVDAGDELLARAEEATLDGREGSKLAPARDDRGSEVDLEALTEARRSQRGGGDGESDGDSREGSGEEEGDVKQPTSVGLSLERIDVEGGAAHDGGSRSDGDGGPGADARSGRGARGADAAGRNGVDHGGRLRDANGDVVDLSELPRSYREAPSPNGALAQGGLDAVLRLEVEVDGVAGVSKLEQPISMSGFRPHRRRYRIERSCLQTAAVGQPMVLRFQINAIASAVPTYEEAPEAAVLHYEVDADAGEWMVAGRRRGQIIVSSAEGDVGQATIIALTAGRLYLPSVKLFERDGCPLGPSRFENVNAGSQVTCLPSVRVISVCSSEPLRRLTLDALANGGERRQHALQRAPSSVATVAADSFFSH